MSLLYSEFINNIINSRGQWNIPEGVYYEIHHIVPKCWGGLPKRPSKTSHNTNIIWLYPQEHFIAHKLLAEEHPTDIRITCAFIRMCYSKNADYEITPEEYAKAKKLQAEAARINSTGKPGTPNKGSLGKHWTLSEETKRLIALSKLGKKRSEETIQKISASKKGKASKNKYASAKKVRCIELDQIFNSLTDAALHFKVTKNLISACVRGKIPTARGYHWEYV